MVAGTGDDHLGHLWQAVGCLNQVFQAFLGCEASHGEQVFPRFDAVFIEKRKFRAAGHGVDAVGDEDALAKDSAFLHLVLVDKDDTVAEPE